MLSARLKLFCKASTLSCFSLFFGHRYLQPKVMNEKERKKAQNFNKKESLVWSDTLFDTNCNKRVRFLSFSIDFLSLSSVWHLHLIHFHSTWDVCMSIMHFIKKKALVSFFWHFTLKKLCAPSIELDILHFLVSSIDVQLFSLKSIVQKTFKKSFIQLYENPHSVFKRSKLCFFFYQMYFWFLILKP